MASGFTQIPQAFCTCGTLIGNKYEKLQELIDQGVPRVEAARRLNVSRICCLTRLMDKINYVRAPIQRMTIDPATLVTSGKIKTYQMGPNVGSSSHTSAPVEPVPPTVQHAPREDIPSIQGIEEPITNLTKDNTMQGSYVSLGYSTTRDGEVRFVMVGGRAVPILKIAQFS